MEPVSSILGGWLVGRVADAVWNGAGSEIQSRLKKSDLTEAIVAGNQAVQEWEKPPQLPQQHLFYRSDPKASRDYLAQAFTDSTVQAELQRPLKQDGEPQLEVVCSAFRQLAKPELRLNLDRLKPWLEVFLEAYVARTSYFLKVGVAQRDYLTQLANWFDDVRFLGVAVESGEIEQAEKLAQIFVMQDVLEEKSTFGADFFLRFSEGNDRQSQLLQEQQLRSQLDRTGRRFSADQLRTQTRSKAVLLGAPGSGKTTLMSYFAVTLAEVCRDHGLN